MPQPRPSHRSVLDELLRPAGADSPAPPTPAAPPAPALTAPQPSSPPPTPSAPPATGRRPRLTVRVDPALLEQARSVVYYSPGLTLTDLTTEALHKEIARREAERGAPFPASRGAVRTGSPIR